jgi:hypothetical protein
VNKTKTAILSISLLNILMNAGIVPVSSTIRSVFPDASPTMLKLTLSISALFSIIFSLQTGYLDRYFPKKVLLAVGLIFLRSRGHGHWSGHFHGGYAGFQRSAGCWCGHLPAAGHCLYR